MRANGTATASVEYRFRIDGTNDTNAFNRLQQDITTNRTQYLNRFERRMNQTVRAAANATNRPMRVTNATVRAETRQLPQPYGVVSYTFTWHGFAAVDTGELRVGDALAGLYLDESTQLQISWPEEYDARTLHESVSEQRASAAIWAGPLWFDRNGPRLVLVQNWFHVGPVPAVLFGLSVVFALSGLAFWWRGHRGEDDRRERPIPDQPPSANPDGGHSTGVSTSSTPRSPKDIELMSNEERVLWEITKHGGRVKQQELVSALDWSDAKVSRAVSSLREQGTVEGFRLGNENVLTTSTETERSGEDA